MFDVLMGSSRGRERRIGRGAVSAMLHIVVIAGVAKATTGGRPGDAPEPRMVDIAVLAVAPDPVPTPVTPLSPGIAAAPATAPSVVAPVQVPMGIPPVTIQERWNPRHLVSASGPPGVPGMPVGAGVFNPDSILSESAADEPAAVLLQRPPLYPPALRAAGLEGRVAVRFVIDVEGRAEPASIRISSTTHPGFEYSARETILKTVFSPARVRGRAVRQWAEQAVVFRISP